MFLINDIIPNLKKKIKIEFGENLTDKQIEEILNKYWLSVLYALNNVENPTVTLNYLGSFNARYSVLKLEIRKTIDKIRNLEDLKTFYEKKLSNMWKTKQHFDLKNNKNKLKNERRDKSIDEC